MAIMRPTNWPDAARLLIGLGVVLATALANAAGAGGTMPGDPNIQKIGADTVTAPDVTTVGPTINASPTPGVAGSGNVFAISAGAQILLNGAVLGGASVIEIYYSGHTAYWQNSGGNWFAPLTATGTGSSVPNPKGGTVPPPAAAVGYNTRTYGPLLVIGSNLFSGDNNPSNHATTNGDGSVTFAGGANPWNGHFLSILRTSNQFGFIGTAFGGGAYFEATLSWSGTYFGYGKRGSRGWPSFWSVNLDNVLTGSNPHIETDFVEYFGQSNPATTFLDWYGSNMSVVSRQAVDSFTVSGNAVHKFGVLWVPATASAKGRAEAYYDRVFIGSITWDQDNPARALPPVGGTTAFSAMDRLQPHVLIFGTSAHNPMTVYSCEVWQANGSQNVTH